MMIRTLGWSLLHFVWQGAAVAAVLASLNLALRRASPQVRYLLASLGLLTMLLLPAVTFQVVGRSTGSLSPAASTVWPAGAWPVVAGGATAPAAVEASGLSGALALDDGIESLLPALVAVWCAGVLFLSVRSFGGWMLVRRLRGAGLSAPPPRIEETLARLVATLRVSAPVRLYESALVGVPTVVGWLRPVILLPASTLLGLSPQQLELILAHELAHVRRADYLVNLLQTAAETLLFYHPAVWWVSHRMRVEREHCCDDLAVSACGSAVRYARALADLEGLCAEAPALAMAASGGSLVGRVARLVGGAPEPSRASRALAALLAGASLALAFGIGSVLLDRPMPTVVTVSAAGIAPASIAAEAEPAEAGRVQEPAPTKAAPAPAPSPTRATPAPAPSDPQPNPRPAAEPQARAFPLERVLEMARAGITPEYIDEMDALGYASLSADQLIALRNQGVGAGYVRELAAEGYTKLSVDQLLGLRSQGVSARYAHELKEQGMTDLSLSNLLALRAQGVSGKYVEELKQAGYGDLSVTSLLSLRSQGVSGRYVAELKALGYEGLSQSKLLALRSQGVSPEYVRELAELGYKGVDPKELLALRSQGVTPGYVKELKEAGYAGLPTATLMQLRAHGVTPKYVRELQAAGFDKLRPEELIELRSQGVSPELLKRLRGRE